MVERRCQCSAANRTPRLSYWIWQKVWGPEFDIDGEEGSGLYYASFLGLEAVVERILIKKPNVNAQGGQYGYALWAASQEGHERIVEMLTDAGADMDAQRGVAGNALQVASHEGHEKVVEILSKKGAYNQSLDDLQLSD